MKKIESVAKHLLVNRPCAPLCHYNGEETFLVNDTGEFEGKVVTKAVLKRIKASDNFAGLRVSDFSAENAIALGVKPSPVSMIGDNFSMMQDIARANAAFDEAIKLSQKPE